MLQEQVQKPPLLPPTCTIWGANTDERWHQLTTSGLTHRQTTGHVITELQPWTEPRVRQRNPSSCSVSIPRSSLIDLVSWRSYPAPPHAGYPREGRQVGPCRPMSVGKVAKYFHCRRICLWIQSVRALSIQVHCSHETSGCSSDSGVWVGAGEAGVEERSRVIGCCADIRNTVNVNNSTGPQIEWGQDVTDGWRPPWYKSFSRGVTLLCLHRGTPYNYSLRNSILNESVLHK